MVIKKPDISYKRDPKIKDYEQTLKYDCGVSALRSVLNSNGMHLSEKTLIDDLDPTIKYGTKLNKIVTVAKKYGFDAMYKRSQTLGDLKKMINDYEIILLTDDHYIVVAGIKEGFLMIEDPATKGEEKLSFKRLNRKWFGMEDDEKTKVNGQAIYIKEKI